RPCPLPENRQRALLSAFCCSWQCSLAQKPWETTSPAWFAPQSRPKGKIAGGNEDESPLHGVHDGLLLFGWSVRQWEMPGSSRKRITPRPLLRPTLLRPLPNRRLRKAPLRPPLPLPRRGHPISGSNGRDAFASLRARIRTRGSLGFRLLPLRLHPRQFRRHIQGSGSRHRPPTISFRGGSRRHRGRHLPSYYITRRVKSTVWRGATSSSLTRHSTRFKS